MSDIDAYHEHQRAIDAELARLNAEYDQVYQDCKEWYTRLNGPEGLGADTLNDIIPAIDQLEKRMDQLMRRIEQLKRMQA